MAMSAVQMHRLGAGPVRPIRASPGGQTRCRQHKLGGCSHRRRGVAVEALRLVPTGDGSCDHLDNDVSLPGAIDLKDGAFEVGREKPVDIIIPVPTVSGHHAMLRIEEGKKLTVTDLNSTNGTYLDGKQLQPMAATEVPLKSEVTFGDKYLAKFQLTES